MTLRGRCLACIKLIQQRACRCEAKRVGAEERLRIKEKEDHMEYDQAKEALGRWLRKSNSEHCILNSLLISAAIFGLHANISSGKQIAGAHVICDAQP
jgi:hypothetical protein